MKIIHQNLKKGIIKVKAENIDDLYAKVNELIDSYFEWKISPSSLRRHLKRGSIGRKKFIERNQLGNIDKINKIIEDVIDDRHGMRLDAPRDRRPCRKGVQYRAWRCFSFSGCIRLYV